ncbi:MAG: hypothetical protein ACI4KM_11940 [Oscillospiraceae bacterium]
MAILHAIIGIRLVCLFEDDLFSIAEEISRSICYKVVNIKYFVSKPKSSGYQSIHILSEILCTRYN